VIAIVGNTHIPTADSLTHLFGTALSVGTRVVAENSSYDAVRIPLSLHLRLPQGATDSSPNPISQ
jgi:hypothetical protein